MKNLAIISFSIFMASCSLMDSVKPVEVRSIAERAPLYHPPLPYPMSLSKVDWEIITPELMQEYLDLVAKGDAPRKAYYALSSKEYENLSMDMAEITRYTKDILSIIKYYRELDKPQEKEDER